MPQAITGNLVRFTGLLKWVGTVVSWQHLQKAMLCLNLLSCFFSVSLFSQGRKSDHCAKCRPKYLFSKCWTFVLLRKCQVNITGYRSFLKVNKTRSTFTLPWVGVRTSHGLRWSPFTGYRDVSLNTQVFISSKSTQTVCDQNRNKVHICQFTSLSEQDYCLCVMGGCIDVPSRGTTVSSPWGLSLSLLYFWRGNKPPAYLLLVLARWNENMLGIQDSVIRMAYIYISSAKCSQAATKDKSESNRDPFKISRHTDLGGLGNQIPPLSIINSFAFLGALSLYTQESKLCWPLVSALLTPVKFSQPCCYCRVVGRNPPALPSNTLNPRRPYSYYNEGLLALETTNRDHGSSGTQAFLLSYVHVSPGLNGTLGRSCFYKSLIQNPYEEECYSYSQRLTTFHCINLNLLLDVDTNLFSITDANYLFLFSSVSTG